MRVLFINRFFYPDQSATARLLTDLAEKSASQGFSVTVITGRVGYLDGEPIRPPEDCYKGVRVLRVWSTRFGRRSSLGRLADYVTFYISAGWRALRCRRIDCMVALSDPPMLSCMGALLRPLKRWKTVCWLQDVFPENAIRAGLLREGWLGRALAWMARWSLRISDRVIVVGRCMERYLLLAGVPGERMIHIPNWADGESLAPLEPDDNWFRKDYGLGDHVVVMYSGNLGLVHDAESLLRVIRALRSRPDILFVFMGYGKGKTYLEDCARREQLANLRFIDYQARRHLRYSLSAGDIHLVSLRSDMEGLSVPSKIYGIMAVGRPVIFIGPEGSEVASVIRESRCGEVFEPADSHAIALAIGELAQDPCRREELGAASRRHFDAMLDKKLALERFGTLFQRLHEDRLQQGSVTEED